MKIVRLINRIKNAEGFSLTPYKDSLGVWTVGWGVTSWDGKKINPNMRPSLDLCKAMFRDHLVTAMVDASTYVINYDELDSIRQEALIEMAYQLGGTKQRKFVKAREAIEQKHWGLAHQEIRDSLWHEQTPARCVRIASMIYQGSTFYSGGDEDGKG